MTARRPVSPDIADGLRWLAALSLVSAVFLATPQGDAYRWVDMSWTALAVVVIAAVLGFLASRGNLMLALGAAAVCFLAAAVQFVASASGDAGVIGGNASTWTLLAALGLGYIVLAIADRIPQASSAE